MTPWLPPNYCTFSVPLIMELTRCNEGFGDVDGRCRREAGCDALACGKEGEFQDQADDRSSEINSYTSYFNNWAYSL
jgi:hypothetical protein